MTTSQPMPKNSKGVVPSEITVVRLIVGMMPFFVAGMTGLVAAFGPASAPAQVHPGVVVGLTIAALLVFAASVHPIARWVVAVRTARRDGRKVGAGRKLFKRFPKLAELVAVLNGADPSSLVGVVVGFAGAFIVWYALNITAVLSLGGTSVWLQIPIAIVSYAVLLVANSYLSARGADEESSRDEP